MIEQVLPISCDHFSGGQLAVCCRAVCGLEASARTMDSAEIISGYKTDLVDSEQLMLLSDYPKLWK